VEHLRTTMKSEKKFESKFLLSDEEIINLGIPSHEIENYRRKYYQVQ
jgi:hypothetical protein